MQRHIGIIMHFYEITLTFVEIFHNNNLRLNTKHSLLSIHKQEGSPFGEPSSSIVLNEWILNGIADDLIEHRKRPKGPESYQPRAAPWEICIQKGFRAVSAKAP